jgi:ABC-2 type transport system ATP-binding protein
MPVLEVRDVVKAYDGKVAVDRVSLEVERGEIFGLLGPNGAGKSSLLRMVMDILRPDSGEILVLGRRLDPSLKDRVGYLPEERGLYPRQRVSEVLEYLGRLKGLSRAAAARRAEAALDRVGLLEVRRRRLRELSKGMQQKLQIAAVLMPEPDLAVLDEPFEGLDPVNRVLVTDLLREHAARGTAIVLSSHRMDQVEAMCRRVFLIHRGRGVLGGDVEKIRDRFADSALLVEADPPPNGHPLVERARPEGRGLRLWLREGASPERFLADLLASGARVGRFERARPSLDEIFVRVVGGEGAP